MIPISLQISQSAAMRRTDMCLFVSAANRRALDAIVADRNSSSKAVWRARIVLATADGLGTNAIMQRTGKSKPCVWRWQERYIEEGVEGLLRDKTRPPGTKPLSAAIKRKVLAKAASQTPPAATHWSVRTMAAEVGISHTSVQRIWAEAGLKPHRVRTFKISNDPQFEEKVSDVVGLYLNPPDKALVLCVDEKAQIQALDRSAPVLPMMPGLPERRTHDYVRHGITTLFAALDVASGQVFTSIHRRHRTVEFKKFLTKLDQHVPIDLDVHLICDNYTTHKHPTIDRWLAAHPRFHMHFTPTYSSWLNQVERWFGLLTDKQLRRSVHKSLRALEQDLRAWTAAWNDDPKPCIWTKTTDEILERLASYLHRIPGAGH